MSLNVGNSCRYYALANKPAKNVNKNEKAEVKHEQRNASSNVSFGMVNWYEDKLRWDKRRNESYSSSSSSSTPNEPVIEKSAIINKNNSLKGFEKIAGMADLKKTLKTDVIDAIKEPELYESYGLSLPNGLLLYGPPGCGKTYIAAALAEEIDRPIITLSIPDVGSRYQHETTQNITSKFREAMDKSPSILFIDEIESLVPSRSELSAEQVDIKEQVSEILRSLNNLNKKGVFVIATTNEPQEMDSAIKRTGRFDKKVFVGPPDLRAREELLKMELKNRRKSDNVDYNKLAKMTENYSSSDVVALVNQAAREALKERVSIDTTHFMKAKDIIPPSLSKEIVTDYKAKGEQ